MASIALGLTSARGPPETDESCLRGSGCADEASRSSGNIATYK
jgi:hypothetical protein